MEKLAAYVPAAPWLTSQVMAKIAILRLGDAVMQFMSARDAKNSFGKLIDMARAEPVAIEKHGRAVVVVLSIESYELLRAAEDGHLSASSTAVEQVGQTTKGDGEKQGGETNERE